METILVAVDLSEATHEVIKIGGELAKSLGANVVLLYVVQPVNSSVPIGSAMDIVALPVPFSKEELEELASQLEKAAAPLKASGIEVETVLKEALPVEEINRQVAAHHVDIIVVGSHGHGALYHLFNGSVVNALLKEAIKPILVVPVKAASQSS
ncbi:MAG: universal stress protein [Chthoniobacterales bacterium]